MQNRSIGKIIALSLVTFGIYAIYLLVKTKEEMNALGADIPTAWLIIVPFVNYWWYWKYSEGVEQVTNKEVSTVLSFVLLILLSGIGQIILQVSFNKVGAQAATGGIAPQPFTNPAVPMEPAAPITPAMPVAPIQPTEPVSPNPINNPAQVTEQTVAPVADYSVPLEQPAADLTQPTVSSPVQSAPDLTQPTTPEEQTPPQPPMSPSNPA